MQKEAKKLLNQSKSQQVCKIEIISLTDQKIIQIKENEGTLFASRFIKLFALETTSSNFRYECEPIQKSTPALVNQIQKLVDEYVEKSPRLKHLNELVVLLKRLQGHYFFFFINNSKKHDYYEIFCWLRSFDDGLSIEQTKKQMDALFGKLNRNYEPQLFGLKQLKVGESDKNKRICRFCGKNQPEVKFAGRKGKAHAISEALGNKKLILNEECKGCNSNLH